METSKSEYDTKSRRLLNALRLIEEIAVYDTDEQPDYQNLYDVIDDCRRIAQKHIEEETPKDSLREELMALIKYYESITVQIWGGLHERPEEFKGSIEHFVWENSETVLMALMVADIDGWAWASMGKDNNTLSCVLNMNDTFHCASADGERISFVDFWKLFVRKYRGDKYADVKFVEERRKQNALEKYHQQMLDFYKEHPEMEGEMPITLLDYEIGENTNDN